MLPGVIIVIILAVATYIIIDKKKKQQLIENEKRKQQQQLEDKRQKQEIIRNNFKKVFPDVEEKFSNLLSTIGKDEKMSIYRTEVSKTFNELLRVFLNIIEADKRLDNLDKLRKNLLTTLETTNNEGKRMQEGIEKSKELIAKINTESNELKKYIANAKDEIAATGLDFVHTATEIELAKSSGNLVELSRLKTKSQNLSYITEHFPVFSDYTN